MERYFKYSNGTIFIFRKRETEEELYFERLAPNGEWVDDIAFLSPLVYNGDPAVDELTADELSGEVNAWLEAQK